MPPLNYSRIDDGCYLDDSQCTPPNCNHFACPLPPGAAEHCHAKCSVGGCIGSSSNLPAAECGAWWDLYDGTGGKNWKYCSDTRPDPCACDRSVACSGSHITTM